MQLCACTPCVREGPVAACSQASAVVKLTGVWAGHQVILAEDTLRPGGPLVAIKILKRQHGYAGLKVCRRTTLPYCGDTW